MSDYKESRQNVLTKITELWEDNRKYRERLLLAFLVMFAMCFTFLFFGPLEITVFNNIYIDFTPSEMFPVVAAFAFVSTLLLTIVLSLLRGKIFDFSLTFLFSFTICGYIQGNFLSRNFGELNGNVIVWSEYSVEILINIILWILFSIVPFIILSKNKIMWGQIIKFLSFTLIMMQLVASFSFVSKGAFDITKDRDVISSQSEMFHYSEESNTVVFVLDQLDYDFIELVMEDSPEFFNELEGFTSYTNATTEYSRTYPSINYLMTNSPDAYDIPFQTYVKHSWNQEDKNIIEEMYNVDYRVNIYTLLNIMFGTNNENDIINSNETISMVSNIVDSKATVNSKKILSGLLTLSAYRYAPIIAKPLFLRYTDEINEGTIITENNVEKFEFDQTIFNEGLHDIKLTEQKQFKFYHFNGSHGPFYMLENGEMSDDETDVVQQTKGSFNILFNAFEQFKQLGIYEDTAIIIMADHGWDYINQKPLLKETRMGLFYKPKNNEQLPLQYSSAPVSQKNIPATILKASGLAYENYGRPIDEIGEDEEIIRYHYKNIFYEPGHKDSGWNEKKENRLYTYEIKGDASDLNNWELIKDEKLEHVY